MRREDASELETPAAPAAATPETVPPGGKPYEKLLGAKGAEVLFRPDRYSSLDLGVAGSLTVSTPGGARLQATLLDVSQTGLAFSPEGEFPVREGDLLPYLGLTFEGYVAYEGRAAVRTLRQVGGRAVVGAAFVESLLNIEDVLRLRDLKKAHLDSAEALASPRALWRVPAHSEFKATVAELSLFLRAAQDEFAKIEQSMQWDEIHGDEDSPVRQQLYRMLDTGFCQDYVQWLARVNDHYLRMDPVASDGLKAYARALLHPLMLESPIVARMYEKPLGYAGDYVVMTYLYSRRFEGRNLYVKAVHRATTFQEGGSAVRGRKDMLKEWIRQHALEKDPAKGPLRIVSVAAGPAQEMYELFQDYPADAPGIDMVLFDQDKQAMSHAHTRLMGVIRRRQLGNVHVTCMHDSIRSLLKGEAVLGERGPFDVIYTAGLFDYLREDLARRLCQWFHSHLAEGGICYVGNFAQYNPSRWSMEHLYEWYLLHRTPEDLIRLVDGFPGIRDVSVAAEPTGVNLLLLFRKG